MGIRDSAGIGRRHPFIRISGGDSAVELTLGALAGKDGGAAVLLFLDAGLVLVEPHLRLAIRLVRPVALEAVVRQNWQYVSIEGDLGYRRQKRYQREL